MTLIIPEPHTSDPYVCIEIIWLARIAGSSRTQHPRSEMQCTVRNTCVKLRIIFHLYSSAKRLSLAEQVCVWNTWRKTEQKIILKVLINQFFYGSKCKNYWKLLWGRANTKWKSDFVLGFHELTNFVQFFWIFVRNSFLILSTRI